MPSEIEIVREIGNLARGATFILSAGPLLASIIRLNRRSRTLPAMTVTVLRVNRGGLLNPDFVVQWALTRRFVPEPIEFVPARS